MAIVFYGTFLIISPSYAGCLSGSGRIINCPSGPVIGSYILEFKMDSGKCRDACEKGSPCVFDCEGCSIGAVEYNLDNGAWADVDDLNRVQDPTTCNCLCQPYGCSDCQGEVIIARVDVSQLELGTHTVSFRFATSCSTTYITDSCTFTIAELPSIAPISPMGYLNSANPNPLFQARVRDDNGSLVRAYFQVVGSGSFVGNQVNSMEISSVGPITFFEDGTYFWYGWAENSLGLISSDSAIYAFTRDTVPPIADIQYTEGTIANTSIHITLIEADERTGIASGLVEASVNGGNWTSIYSGTADFDYPVVNGNTYRFRYTVTDGAGNTNTDTGGTVTVVLNNKPSASNLNFSVPDFCSSSPAYFFSWTYSDADNDTQSRFDFQVDDSGASFPSPEIDRTYSGLSNPSPSSNNQAVIVLPSAQSDYLTYNRTYNWRVRVYDSRGLDSGWINGTAFNTPNHRAPICNFTWSPINPSPQQSVNFSDTSICYDLSGSQTPCANWNWTFTDANPSSSTQQNPTTQFLTSGTKDVTLTVTDSFGKQCSTTKQVIVNLPLPKWKEIRPW